MARDLQLTENNTLTLMDPIGKTAIVFFHRSPTTDDRVSLMVNKFKRSGNKLIDRSRSALIDAAAEVLTGIRTGDFVFGKVPLSSTPGEEGYREDWKELLKAAAGDLLFLMGNDLFEAKLSLDDLDLKNIISEFEAGADEEPPPSEIIPPLAKSSGGSGKSAPRSGKRNARQTAGRD